MPKKVQCRKFGSDARGRAYTMSTMVEVNNSVRKGPLSELGLHFSRMNLSLAEGVAFASLRYSLQAACGYSHVMISWY